MPSTKKTGFERNDLCYTDDGSLLCNVCDNGFHCALGELEGDDEHEC